MKYAFVIIAALTLGACGSSGGLQGFLDAAVGGSAEKAAVALDKYCSTVPKTVRKVAVEAINMKAKAKVTPFDCDGDGKSDF